MAAGQGRHAPRRRAISETSADTLGERRSRRADRIWRRPRSRGRSVRHAGDIGTGARDPRRARRRRWPRAGRVSTLPASAAVGRRRPARVDRRDRQPARGVFTRSRRPLARQPLVLLVASPLADVRREQREALEAMLIGIPIVLLLAAAGGMYLAAVGLRPITEALRIQRQFTADASHELRTPVSVVRAAAEVALSREHRDEAEYRETLSIVGSQARRMSRLVDDMLVLARADAGGYPLRPVDSLSRRGDRRVLSRRRRARGRARRHRFDRAPSAGDSVSRRRRPAAAAGAERAAERGAALAARRVGGDRRRARMPPR